MHSGNYIGQLPPEPLRASCLGNLFLPLHLFRSTQPPQTWPRYTSSLNGILCNGKLLVGFRGRFFKSIERFTSTGNSLSQPHASGEATPYQYQQKPYHTHTWSPNLRIHSENSHLHIWLFLFTLVNSIPPPPSTPSTPNYPSVILTRISWDLWFETLVAKTAKIPTASNCVAITQFCCRSSGGMQAPPKWNLLDGRGKCRPHKGHTKESSAFKIYFWGIQKSQSRSYYDGVFRMVESERLRPLPPAVLTPVPMAVWGLLGCCNFQDNGCMPVPHTVVLEMSHIQIRTWNC